MNEEIVLKRLKDNLSLLSFKSQLTYFEFQLRFVLEDCIKLIEKQQKEIEELSIIKNSIQTLETNFVNDDTYYVIAKENFLEGDFRHLLDDYISKDKIKEKIKEWDKNIKWNNADDHYYAIKILEELLGEINK